MAILDTGGTQRWMAPELLDHDRAGLRKNSSVDVYAFAMLMYELLTYQIPFKDYSPVEVMTALLMNQERPDIPQEKQADFAVRLLGGLMTRCWAEDPAERPPAAALAKIIHGYGRKLQEAEESPDAQPIEAGAQALLQEDKEAEEEKWATSTSRSGFKFPNWFAEVGFSGGRADNADGDSEDRDDRSDTGVALL